MTVYAKLSDSIYDREIRSSTDALVKPEEVLFTPEERLSFHAAVKKWPRLSLYCLGLTTTIILVGYDGALVGSVAGMPEFKYVSALLLSMTDTFQKGIRNSH